MGDKRRGLGEQGRFGGHQRIALELGVARQRPDAQPAVRQFLDPAQLGHAGDVEQQRWGGKSEVESRQQALPAGEEAAFLAAAFQHVEHLG